MALREQSEAYAGNFASENDALTLDNTFLWEKNAESSGTSRGPTRVCKGIFLSMGYIQYDAELSRMERSGVSDQPNI